MPHECVECGEVFEDGADEVFDGCPDCGATKFFYVKEVTDEDTRQSEAGAPDRERNVGTEPSVEPEANEAVGVEVETSSEPDAPTNESGTTPESQFEVDTLGSTSPEETSDVPTQTAADTDTDSDDDIVEAKSEYEDSLTDAPESPESGDGVIEAPEDETADPETETKETREHRQEDGTEARPPFVTTDDEGRKFRRARPEEARRRLLDQFETIRIVEPGSYELNLMNLYEEDEKIIALQEDGKYQVSLPSTIGDD